MGYDITFHPIKKEELNRFVFDVIKDGTLAESRAVEITKNADKQKEIIEIYKRFPGFIKDIQAEEADFENTIGFASAAIAGYLHPYWYSRDLSISFSMEEKHKTAKEFLGFLESLASLDRDLFSDIEDSSDGILTGSNYAGSGFIDFSKISDLKFLLTEKKYSEFIDVYFGDYKNALLNAVDYCEEFECGILEATDIVVPVEEACYSDINNFRADFLNSESDKTNAREI